MRRRRRVPRGEASLKGFAGALSACALSVGLTVRAGESPRDLLAALTALPTATLLVSTSAAPRASSCLTRRGAFRIGFLAWKGIKQRFPARKSRLNQGEGPFLDHISGRGGSGASAIALHNNFRWLEST